MCQNGWEKLRIPNHCYNAKQAKVTSINPNVHVRKWIILEKASPNSPILDGLGVQSGVETWKG